MGRHSKPEKYESAKTRAQGSARDRAARGEAHPADALLPAGQVWRRNPDKQSAIRWVPVRGRGDDPGSDDISVVSE